MSLAPWGSAEQAALLLAELLVGDEALLAQLREPLELVEAVVHALGGRRGSRWLRRAR